jgi:hypothetical protein
MCGPTKLPAPAAVDNPAEGFGRLANFVGYISEFVVVAFIFGNVFRIEDQQLAVGSSAREGPAFVGAI